MPARPAPESTPTPPVFTIGLREIAKLFRGRVVRCGQAYLVPDNELLLESATPGGYDVVALPPRWPNPMPGSKPAARATGTDAFKKIGGGA